MNRFWLLLILFVVGCGETAVSEPQATPFLSTRVPTPIPPPTITPFSAELMQASDPARFERASGQLQLVELFAFW